jgi:hypothetical protein
MKVLAVLLTLLPLAAELVSGAYVDTAIAPKTTFTNTHHYVAPTGLAKREAEAEADARKAIVNKQWLKEESEKLHGTSEEPPKPWIRTIHETVVEVVTPYVVGGVTFAAPRPATTDSLEPWISLNDDGLPKTIKPRLKNGKVDKGYPDVKTYFQTATTITHHQEDLKAHNLNEDDVVEEVKMIEEDDTYVQLNPIGRCTPDFYYKRGVANMESSEPFCKPKDHRKMRVGLTYFVTWYTRFFGDAEKVKFHYAYVNEKHHDKGFDKRDLLDSSLKNVDAELEELSGNVQFHGDVHGAFYSSDWITNENGWYNIDVDQKWLKGKVYKKVVIAMQPDTVADEDFSILDAPHFFATFQLRESIGKNTKAMRKLQDQAGTNDDVYYIIASIPTMVLIAVCLMYGFLYLNRKHRDLSHIKKPKRSRFGNQGKYNIPVALTDIHKPNKQS